MQNEDMYQTFADMAVIKPPETRPDFETLKRFTRVVIDSKDRNISLFPNPNNYEVNLEDEIEDVLNAQLLNIDIPLSSYMINSIYNSFEVAYDAGAYQTVSLAPGDYDVQSFITEVKSKLNALFSKSFDVEYDPRKDNFVLKSTSAFTLRFSDMTCRFFGFDKGIEYTSSESGVSPLTNVLQAPFRKDFKYNNYIVMTIDQFDINKSNNNRLNKSFAIITNNYSAMNISDDPQIKKHFSPPLARLTKLRIKFFDRFGNPYDFSNMDHHFELLFESFKQKRKYQNIFFNR